MERRPNPEQEKAEILSEIKKALDKISLMRETGQRKTASGQPWTVEVNSQLQAAKSFMELGQPYISKDRYRFAMERLQDLSSLMINRVSYAPGVETDVLDQEDFDDVADRVEVISEIIFGPEHPDLVPLRHSLNPKLIAERIHAEQARSGQDWTVCFMSRLAEVGPYLQTAQDVLEAEKYQQANQRYNEVVKEARALQTPENRGNANFPPAEKRQEMIEKLASIKEAL